MARGVVVGAVLLLLLAAAASTTWACDAATASASASASAERGEASAGGCAPSAGAARTALAFSFDMQGPVYDLNLFPRMAAVLPHWERMRDEALAITHDMGLHRKTQAIDNPEAQEFLLQTLQAGNNGWTTAWSRDRLWKNYFLVSQDEIVPGVTAALCPFTTSLLGSIPGMRVAAFSKLLPGAHIEEHVDNAGLSSGSLIFHYFLTGHGRMRLGSTWLDQAPGQALVFDSNVPHEVVNGDEERTIVYIELDLREFFLKTEGIVLSEPAHE